MGTTMSTGSLSLSHNKASCHKTLGYVNRVNFCLLYPEADFADTISRITPDNICFLHRKQDLLSGSNSRTPGSFWDMKYCNIILDDITTNKKVTYSCGEQTKEKDIFLAVPTGIFLYYGLVSATLSEREWLTQDRQVYIPPCVVQVLYPISKKFLTGKITPAKVAKFKLKCQNVINVQNAWYRDYTYQDGILDSIKYLSREMELILNGKYSLCHVYTRANKINSYLCNLNYGHVPNTNINVTVRDIMDRFHKTINSIIVETHSFLRDQCIEYNKKYSKKITVEQYIEYKSFSLRYSNKIKDLPSGMVKLLIHEQNIESKEGTTVKLNQEYMNVKYLIHETCTMRVYITVTGCFNVDHKYHYKWHPYFIFT